MFIIDPEKITLNQLKDHDIYVELHDLVLSYDLADEIQEAQDLYNKLLLLLEGDESNFDQELLGKYKKLLVLLQFISLPSQTDEVISKLFKENLLMAIYHGVEVKGKIELYILYFSTNNFAEQLSRIILKSLSENSERIGGKPLEITGELKPLEPLVKNWLKDYMNFSVNYKIRDDLSLSSYINQSKNIKQLSSKGIEVIITIIKIHNFLNFPLANTKTVIGTSHVLPAANIKEKEEVKAAGHTPRIIPRAPKMEEINKIGYIAKPVAEKKLENTIPPSPKIPLTPFIKGENNAPRIKSEAEKNLAELKQLVAKYPPGSLERKAVEEEIGKREVGSGNKE